jgi:hypothetical protein
MKNFVTCLVLFTAILSAGPGSRAEGEPASVVTSAHLPGLPVLGPTLLGHDSKIKASAIRVEMIQSDEINLPAEFQVALYENVIQQLQKKAGGLHVYRDGDHNAANIPDLVVLHSTVRGFTQGSAEKRQVTTIAGATSITVHCQFSDAQGKILVEQDIKGKVRFFGENLKATNDFAKKAAKVAGNNFSVAGST